MAKLSKRMLKEIVKECLVEILNEGISGNSLNNSRHTGGSISENKRTGTLMKNMSKNNLLRSTRPALDSVSYGKEQKIENGNFSKNVSSAVNSLTSDPVLSSIFEDTARTTLQEQKSSESSSSSIVSHMAAAMSQGDTAAKIVAQNDPTDIFGGAAEKWASLAFSDSANK